MVQKMNNSPRVNRRKTCIEGIPETLSRIHLEKKTDVVTCKVEFSIKNLLRRYAKPSVSAFVRAAIVEKLEREGDSS